MSDLGIRTEAAISLQKIADLARGEEVKYAARLCANSVQPHFSSSDLSDLRLLDIAGRGEIVLPDREYDLPEVHHERR
jgi:hypothetical protein